MNLTTILLIQVKWLSSQTGGLKIDSDAAFFNSNFEYEDKKLILYFHIFKLYLDQSFHIMSCGYQTAFKGFCFKSLENQKWAGDSSFKLLTELMSLGSYLLLQLLVFHYHNQVFIIVTMATKAH